MKVSKWFPITLVAFYSAMLFFTACKKDENESASGQLNLEITDGPIDDASVKGVFVTVAEVKVDGQTFSGFSGKKTINLLSYQQGNVAALGLGELQAGTYQNISLVLDHASDASGNSPGCYVLTADNLKHELAAGANQTLVLTKNFTVNGGQTTHLVIDFDLRKAIQYENGGSDKYEFVATADLQAALRLMVKNTTGSIDGTCQNSLITTDKIIVYAYKKGQFNREVEVQSQNGVSFKNAVASAVVGNDNHYHLAFLESGEYELHFAAYRDNNSDGRLEFQGTLLLSSLVNLLGIQVGAESETRVEVLVTGILP